MQSRRFLALLPLGPHGRVLHLSDPGFVTQLGGLLAQGIPFAWSCAGVGTRLEVGRRNAMAVRCCARRLHGCGMAPGFNSSLKSCGGAGWASSTLNVLPLPITETLARRRTGLPPRQDPAADGTSRVCAALAGSAAPSHPAPGNVIIQN